MRCIVSVDPMAMLLHIATSPSPTVGILTCSIVSMRRHQTFGCSDEYSIIPQHNEPGDELQTRADIPSRGQLFLLVPNVDELVETAPLACQQRADLLQGSLTVLAGPLSLDRPGDGAVDETRGVSVIHRAMGGTAG